MRFILILIASIILFSCGNSVENLSLEDDFKEISVNNTYSMKLAKYMKKWTGEDQNEDASLQYMNLFKETYLMVIDEDKETFVSTFKAIDDYDESLTLLENYKNIQLESLEEGAQKLGVTEPKKFKIQDLDALSVELDAKVPDIYYDITYFLTFIEGKENIYMIMAWTLKDDKDKYRDTFEKSANSFRLLGEDFAPKKNNAKKH